MRGAALALIISACGRCDFAPNVPDGGAIDGASYAPVTFVQDNATSSGSTQVIAIPFSTAQLVGDTIIVVVNFTTTITSISDARGNSYRQVVGPTNGGTTEQSIYLAADIAAAAPGANTISVTTSGSDDLVLRVLEYTGLDGTIDGTPISAGAGGTPSLDSGPITTTGPDLLLAASWCSSAVAGGASGFGQRLLFQTTLVDELVTDAPGTFHATMTQIANGNGDEVIQLVPFRRARR